MSNKKTVGFVPFNPEFSMEQVVESAAKYIDEQGAADGVVILAAYRDKNGKTIPIDARRGNEFVTEELTRLAWNKTEIISKIKDESIVKLLTPNEWEDDAN